MTELLTNKQNIINLIGIESLPIDKKEEIIEMAIDLVEMRSLERIIDSLSNDKLEKFQEVLNSESEEEIYNFLKENNIDILKINEEETKKVKEEMINAAGDLNL